MTTEVFLKAPNYEEKKRANSDSVHTVVMKLKSRYVLNYNVMSGEFLPEKVRFVGLYVNEITFDVFNIDNQTISAILLPVLAEDLLDTTTWHILGRMRAIVLEKTYNREVLKGKVNTTQNWFQLWSKYIKNCRKSLYAIDRMMKTYLKEDVTNAYIESISNKITSDIKRGNYIVAQATMFELLAAMDNYYTRSQRRTELKTAYQVNDLKSVYFELNSGDHIKSKFLQNNSNINYNLVLKNVVPGISYRVPFTLDASPFDAEIFNSIILFTEYTFDKQPIEKALEILESIMFAQDICKISDIYVCKFLVQVWYAILKTAYEQQKDKDKIKIVQPYTPFMQAYLEAILKEERGRREIWDVTPYVLMPVAVYVQILNSISEHDIHPFVTYTTELGDTYGDMSDILIKPQLISAYYSSSLSKVFDCLLQQNNCNSDNLFLFEVLLRSLFSIKIPPIVMIDGSEESGDPEHGYYFKQDYNELRKRCSDERCIVPVTIFIYPREKLPKNTFLCEKLYRLGYVLVDDLELPTDQNQVYLNHDLLEYVAPAYRGNLNEEPYTFRVYIVPAQVV